MVALHRCDRPVAAHSETVGGVPAARAPGECPVSTRVLSSEEAKTTITQLKATLDGGLLQTLNTLKAQGTTLSDPNVWDGVKATEFRGYWQETAAKLDAVKLALDDLHSKINAINTDILSAGGNA
jgi:uncharacterized protein YukE